MICISFAKLEPEALRASGGFWEEVDLGDDARCKPAHKATCGVPVLALRVSDSTCA
ncbi:MAG TPA: hypothetical protein VGD37_27380 [Kofleriaceae bacterium]